MLVIPVSIDTPIQRALLSDAVHGRLRAAILSGELAPGEALPSERELSASLQVNRNAVREALKRLEHAGLVAINQGGATRVQDWRTSGGIDLLFDLALVGDEVDSATYAAILEMRAAVASDAARLCSQRADQATRTRIAGQLRAVAAGSADFGDYEDLWQHVIDGAQNIAYRLAYNTLLAGQQQLGPEILAVYAPELSETGTLDALAQAFEQGDGDAAAGHTRTLLMPAAERARNAR
jgi:GntR family transcriptional repressor for pyruvate dehydrogenase complex